MYTFIDSYDKLSEFISYTKKTESRIVSLDLETNSLDFFSGKILLLQIKVDDSIFILDVSKFKISYIKDILTYISKKFLILGHNIKFDMKFILHNYNVILENVHDTMIIESALNMGIGQTFYSLEELVTKYIGVQLEKDTRKEFINHNGIFTEQQLIYSALDVNYLLDIYYEQKERIKEANFEEIYELECMLVPVLAEIEYTGVNFDKNAWVKLEEIARAKIEPLNKLFIDTVIDKIFKRAKRYTSLFDVATDISIPVKTKRDTLALEQITDITQGRQWLEEHINIESSKQVKSIFNNLFNIKCENTDAKTLEKYKENEIVTILLNIREQGKKITTYGIKFITDNVNVLTNRIHTEFISTGTSTGRFSSANPNLQNIPTEKAYRHCFIPTDGWLFICADYSQQEMRITGAIAREQNLIDAFLTNTDVHTYTASVIFDKEPKDITKDERRIGKTMNFAVLYGASDYGVAYNLKMEIEQARDIISKFYSKFSSLTSFKQIIEEQVLENMYSSTVAGRRRYFEKKTLFLDYKELNKYVNRVKREGFNQVIQGTGADTTKLALVLIRNKNPFGDNLRILLTVHDEIVCEARKEIVEDAAIFVTDMMLKAEKIYLGIIPAAVEYSIDSVWEKDDPTKKRERILA